LNPLVVMHFVSGAHNDALMVGLIAAGFAFAVRRQPMLGVVLVTLAGGIKPIGLVALPFVGLIWAGPKAPMSQIVKRWAASLVVCAAILVLLAMATGTGFGWVNAIGTSSSVRTWLSPPTALGLTFGMIGDLAGLDLTRTLVAISRGTAAIVAGLAIAYLCLRPADRNPVRAAGLAFLVLVILGPVVQPWYLLWSLPLLAAAGLSKRETKWVIYGTFALAAFSLASHFLDGAGYT